MTYGNQLLTSRYKHLVGALEMTSVRTTALARVFTTTAGGKRTVRLNCHTRARHAERAGQRQHEHSGNVSRETSGLRLCNRPKDKTQHWGESPCGH